MAGWTADLRYAVTEKPPYFGHYLINCPYHEDSVESGAVYPDGFHCFACGESRSAMRFLADVKRLSLPEDYDQLKALADALPRADERQRRQRKPDPAQLEGRVRQWAIDLQTGGNAAAYFRSRGLDNLAILRAGVGWTGRAYSIPLYDRAGKLFSVKYRRADDLEPEAPKYWTQAGFGQTAIYYPPLINWEAHSGPVVVCEGELDALRLAQEGVPAVSVTNGVNAIAGAIEARLFPTSSLVLCLDQDDPAKAALAEILYALKGKVGAVSVAAWPLERGKDVTEVFQNGHGEGLLKYLRKLYAGVL